MKIKLCIGIFLLAAIFAQAQTNSLTALLQQGLFEEQADRNLTAAIADYQNLAAQFDKDRQLAATAVFRLGECYRAMGRTNEAAAQYQRIVHEFSDQQTLATLSRQNLAGMDMAGPTTATEKPAVENPDAALWNKLKGMSRDELAKVLPTVVPDSTLDSLLQQRNAAQAALAQLETDYSASNVVVLRQKALLNELDRQTDERVNGMMQGLQLRAELPLTSRANNAQQMKMNLLTKQIAQTEQDLAETQSHVHTPEEIRAAEAEIQRLKVELADLSSSRAELQEVSLSEENAEIARIQQMIQNSPDLINANALDGGNTPLMNAAHHGWLKVAAYLLDHGANVNFYGTSSRVTPLVMAILAGNKAMAKYLIDRGADINFKDVNGSTPLQVAARNGFQAVTEVLLASHAEVNARDNSGESALFSAVQGGQLKIVQMILAAGADVNLADKSGRTVLNSAIRASPEIVRALLDAGVNPNTEDSSGRAALTYAVEADNLDEVKWLLAAKADPNGGKRNAPLLAAIFKKDPAIAETLLQAGANPKAVGSIDFEISGDAYFSNHNAHLTPLWLAIYLKEPSMVQLLLKFRADPNDSQTHNESVLFDALPDTNMLAALLEAGGKTEARRPDGRTLLADAVNEKNLAVVRLLLKFKADPNLSQIDGRSVLFYALSDTNMLEALLDAGAEVDPVTKDDVNWTPLANAISDNNAAAVQVLLRHGANPNVQNSNGATPLHWAAYRLVDSGIVELLFASKADPNVRNSNGRTPLDELKATAESLDGLPERTAAAARLADSFRRHGALDNLPDCITLSRPPAKFSFPIFWEGTNDWNQFTLLETLANFYFSSQSYSVPQGNNTWAGYSLNSMLPYPDLTRVVIVRPSHGSTNEMRITVNLLNQTNGINCSKDVPLMFGDVVEIPERDHALGDSAAGLTGGQSDTLNGYIKGTVRLEAGGKQVEIPFYRIGDQARLGIVLNNQEARNILLASSDLAHVKLIRHDSKTGERHEWILDCNSLAGGGAAASQPLAYQWYINGNNSGSVNNSPPASALWLRDGDVIEVPEKR